MKSKTVAGKPLDPRILAVDRRGPDGDGILAPIRQGTRIEPIDPGMDIARQLDLRVGDDGEQRGLAQRLGVARRGHAEIGAHARIRYHDAWLVLTSHAVLLRRGRPATHDDIAQAALVFSSVSLIR
ncbi:MAG: hypothetical protein KIT19_08160 [Phycisphaeraceae bacterium]|nr:hypothetical protein [Phycisphaeraceae bacterium]